MEWSGSVGPKNMYLEYDSAAASLESDQKDVIQYLMNGLSVICVGVRLDLDQCISRGFGIDL